MPLYEKMSQYNLPIWIHPMRTDDYADYKTENRSMYALAGVFGWPYETTIAMARLVFSGILEKYPGLKIITHHCGAMVPYFEQRITCTYDAYEMTGGERHKQGLTKALIEYFKMFYNDTALYGSTPGLMCAYAFFGADHMLFGTDMPFDNQFGERFTRQTISSIEQMDISDLEKKKIFEDNARRLLKLPV
jgi:aminocarboxymuconate-semialdehyde decarboxylase